MNEEQQKLRDLIFEHWLKIGNDLDVSEIVKISGMSETKVRKLLSVPGKPNAPCPLRGLRRDTRGLHPRAVFGPTRQYLRELLIGANIAIARAKCPDAPEVAR